MNILSFLRVKTRYNSEYNQLPHKAYAHKNTQKPYTNVRHNAQSKK